MLGIYPFVEAGNKSPLYEIKRCLAVPLALYEIASADLVSLTTTRSGELRMTSRKGLFLLTASVPAAANYLHTF
jgi:hypothetical protein